MQYILWFFTCLFPFTLLAQSKYDNHWTIGYDTSLLDPGGDVILLKFDQNEVNAQTVKTVDGFLSAGSSTTISDQIGKLAFYSSGCYIVNAENEIMENGDSINPGIIQQYYCPFGYSPNAGGSIAIPWPDSPNLFLLFVTDWERTDFPGGPSGFPVPRHLYYNVIDISKNGGLGKVIFKNQIALEDTMARSSVEACRHANGRDWWVLIPKSRSNCYFLTLITPEGISPSKLICSGNDWEGDSGQACFTPDGSKFIRIERGAGLHIYNFDNASGDLTYLSQIIQESEFSTASVGVTVSPNSRYLYVSLLDKLLQYDLYAPDVSLSKILLLTTDSIPDPFVPAVFTISGLAPDGKIYISSGTSHLSLHVIHRPDCQGLYSLPERRGLGLPSLNYYSIPNMPHYRNEPSNYPCDSITSGAINLELVNRENDIKLFPNPSSGFVNLLFKQNPAQNSSWVLIDKYSRIVKKVELYPNVQEYNIHLDEVSSGMYFQFIRTNEKVLYQGKVVLLR